MNLQQARAAELRAAEKFFRNRLLVPDGEYQRLRDAYHAAKDRRRALEAPEVHGGQVASIGHAVVLRVCLAILAAFAAAGLVAVLA